MAGHTLDCHHRRVTRHRSQPRQRLPQAPLRPSPLPLLQRSQTQVAARQQAPNTSGRQRGPLPVRHRGQLDHLESDQGPASSHGRDERVAHDADEPEDTEVGSGVGEFFRYTRVGVTDDSVEFRSLREHRGRDFGGDSDCRMFGRSTSGFGGTAVYG